MCTPGVYQGTVDTVLFMRNLLLCKSALYHIDHEKLQVKTCVAN